jgi:GWxTD domain-containing protein
MGWVVAAALAAAGCGNWQRVGSTTTPDTQSEVAQLFDPYTLYARLGRLVSTEGVPYVGSAAFVPGPGDSTVAMVALSLANRNLSFERHGNGFQARYHLEYEFARPNLPAVEVDRDAVVDVPTFDETLRTDESILEQQRITLVPGTYQLTVRVHDLANGALGTATHREVAPAFGANSYTAPILTYRFHPRATRNDTLSLVLNPRGTVAYGGDTLLVYVEGNDFSQPTDVPLTVIDQRDSVVLRSAVHFDGTGGLEGRVIRLAPDSEPLGELQIRLGPSEGSEKNSDKFTLAAGGDLTHTVNALVSFSSNWVVTNFDDLLSLLRYFGQDRRVEAMRRAKSTDRVQLWQDFYHATDPNPSTPENEALDAYFSRLAIANQRFREGTTPGWRTDRGEVFMVLGEPDVIHDQTAQLQNNGRIYLWEYQQYRLELIFQDITGFGRFELTPQSRSDFDQIRTRVQHSG